MSAADQPIDMRSLRDAIKRQLAALPWMTRGHGLRLDNEHDLTTAAGVLRKAIAPQLAQQKEDRATILRVRHLLRQYQGLDAIPLRKLEAAIYGDEDYLNAR